MIMDMTREKIVARLTERMDLDRIFMASYSFLDVEQTHLLLVINPISGVSPKVMAPVAELCLMDNPGLSFELVTFGDWRNKLKNGSMFYAFLSLPVHRIYASDRKPTRDLQGKEISTIRAFFADIKHEMETQISDYDVGAAKFAEAGNYLKASFMQYQHVKITVSLLQIFVQARANNVPLLTNRLRSLFTHFPVLRSHFWNSQHHHLEILGLLDKAHAAVNQNRDLVISREDYRYLSHKWSTLRQEIMRLFLAIDKRLQETVSASTDSETTSDDSGADANKLIAEIQKCHNPEQIILLNPLSGSASDTLFLMAFMKKRGPIRHRHLTRGKARVLVLFKEVETFGQQLLNIQSPHHRFYLSTLHDGRMLHRK